MVTTSFFNQMRETKMSILSKIATKEKTIHVKYPNSDFELELAYVPKERLQQIRNRALKSTWDAKERVTKEEVDNDIFLEEYSKAVIKGWSGLTVDILSTIMAVDITEDPELTLESVIPYSQEEAVALMDNSSDFDSWITSVINDVERFSTVKKEQEAKNLKTTSSTT